MKEKHDFWIGDHENLNNFIRNTLSKNQNVTRSTNPKYLSSPDIDNNGYLDKNDFECLALRNTLIEGRGDFKADAYANNQKIMSNLWNEIAELADFNKVKFRVANLGMREVRGWFRLKRSWSSSLPPLRG